MNEPALATREQFKTLTLEQVEEQIAVRERLRAQMVGWLYPSILTDEIATLRAIQWALKYPKLLKESTP